MTQVSLCLSARGPGADTQPEGALDGQQLPPDATWGRKIKA